MKHKKALSLLLVFALMLTSIPASAFADTAPSDTVPIKPVVENGSDMTSDPTEPAVPSKQAPANRRGRRIEFSDGSASGAERSGKDCR